MPGKVFSFRLDEGLVSRIDEVSSDRTGFVREALERALAGASDGSVTSFNRPKRERRPDPAVEAVKAAIPEKVRVPAKKGFTTPLREADKAAVLDLIRKKRVSSRQAEQEMGWPGLRYANAEKALLADGTVEVVNGLLEVCDG